MVKMVERRKGLHSMETGQLLANRWQVLDAIGGGGMGDVYRCWDLNLRTPVAVKILMQDFQGDRQIVERFHREVEVLIRSAHPNIAVIHACSSRDDEPPVFLVMEFLNGPTLKMVMDETPGRRLHPQRIRRVGTQILDALDAVHARGIIHRDLKPENIFVLRSGSGRRNVDVVKVIDFGIAKSQPAGQMNDGPSLTQVGTVVGTPYYMAPEQCLGSATVDHRADLYAMGVILFEAATGRLPFDRPTREEIMAAHIGEAPIAPTLLNPEISLEFEMVILKALAKKARARFQSASELSEALEEAIPEDPQFYREDSQRPSPVNGRPPENSPRVAAVDDDNAAPQPIVDVSATPTRKIRSSHPTADDIALAITLTPTDLRRRSDRPVAPQTKLGPKTPAKQREIFNAAVQHLKRVGVWINKVPRRTKIAVLAGTGLAILLLVALAAITPRGGKGLNTATDAGAGVKAATTNHEEEETPPGPVNQRDVVVIQVPVPLPTSTPITTETPPDAETPAPPEVASQPDVVDVETPTPPAGYAELLEEGRAALQRGNQRLAIRKLEEATQLWPKGPDAWEAMGDAFVLLGKPERAGAAYSSCLELLPADAVNRRIRLEGRLRALR